MEPAKSDDFAVVPPLESFLAIKDRVLEKHFFDSLNVGDVICGEVRTARSAGFPIDVLCCCHGPVRDLTQCRIKGFLPFKAMPPLLSKTMEKGDYIRAVVSEINYRQEQFELSLFSNALPKRLQNIDLGIIDKDDLPLFYRLIARSSPFDSNLPYSHYLKSSVGFANPSCISSLVAVLEIDDIKCQSQLPSLRRLKIPEEELALNLRQKQSRQHAHQCVELGIRYAKRGEIASAVRQFNRALDLDNNNVEALVARGALYANREDFKKAIENFEKALSADPSHSGARQYLYESLVGQALSLAKERCYESARRNLRKAGDVIPEKRTELADMAARFVSPSLAGVPLPVSSPNRLDLSENYSKSPSSPPRSKRKSVDAISVSSSAGSGVVASPLSVSSKESPVRDNIKRKKRHRRDKKSKKKHHKKSPERHHQRQYLSSSAKRPRLVESHHGSSLSHRRSLSSTSEKPPSSHKLSGSFSTSKQRDHDRGGESLEDMEKFLQALKQKRSSLSR